MYRTGPRSPSSPPRRRQRGVLVLALLLGLLGMHALGPGGGTGHAEHGSPAQHTAMPGVASVAAAGPDDCPDVGGHCGGRLHHADPTCASGAVNGGPQLPALVPGPVAVPAQDPCPRSRVATGPDGARAPPSLAELQLLRI
ncbi:DUF6153 family protein [Streptomyces alanosinicus]|uniref:DUF1328 domain-containing protein n=1 Tax=Streptomyces alanosinicus TaxID=68171 RepID=A0A918YGZ2_9ACTN|nr:DUF6153 family protein [Streptomyces alanosinicus]GHE02725.1 hypothetical protein GCM10010339_27030 [Streptomyces alanosinicus]